MLKRIIITTMLIAASPIAYAGDVISVKEKPLQPFAPLGIKAGSFLLHPSIALEEEYNNNIFAAATNEESDFITTLKPGFEAKSNWDRHAASLEANAAIGLYADNADENFEDYTAALSGRYDITHKTFFDAKLSYNRTHEDRSSPNDVGGDEPTEIDVLKARLGFTRALARLKLYLHTAVENLDFKDNATGNTPIDNDFRDRLQKEAGIKLAYEFAPGTEIFTQALYDDRDYDRAATTDRSSDGYRLRAGLSHTITGKLKGDLYGGYIAQNYGAGLKDVSTPDFGASLLWNPSALTSVIANLNREVFETTSAGISGYVRTQSSLELQHAFRENIIGGADIGYAYDDYVGATRDDDIIRAGAEIGYKPRRGLDTLLRYDYADRDSNIATQDYTNHRLMLRLKFSR